MGKLTPALLIAIWVLVHGSNPLLAQTSSQNTRPDPLPLAKRPPGRLVVSILWFENRAGSDAAHWRYGIEGFLSGQLRQVRAVRLRGGVGYARRKLDIERGSPLNTGQARKIGEIVEAQRVIWGSYQRCEDKWQVSVRVLNVATGEVSDPLTAASTDWREIRDSLTEEILAELQILPSEEEQEKLIRRATKSSEAFEWYIKAYALQAEGKPLSEQEECMRRAVATDPSYAEGYRNLAAVHGSQGEFEQAREMVRRALEIKPDDAGSYVVLGKLHAHEQEYAEAEIALHKALRLEPDDAIALAGLAQLYGAQGQWDKAIVFAEKAIGLTPMDASIHAHLALAYAHRRNREEAMLELKEAQRLADPEDLGGLNAMQLICQAYRLLGQIPRAVEHYETFVTQARKMGANPELVNSFERAGQHLRATLTPTFVEVQMPEMHTAEALQRVLQERLTKSELRTLANPVASSQEMRRWARELTEGANSEFDKAKAIFDGLTRRIQSKGGFGTRTAQEVFSAWNDPNESFSCQEFGKLYLALAREVGLKTFYVHLGQDFRGRLISHDCATVFVGGRALLVDPAYQWFGAPHKEFVVLDDVQTIAHHLFQHTPGERLVSRCRLAAKLHPDFAWGQLCLARALWAEDQREEARKALETATRLEPGRWDACRLRGLMAVDSEDWDTAKAELREALALNPEDAESHFLLGDALTGENRLEEAREAYRACLTHCVTDTMADHARRAIVQINEKIGGESTQEHKTAALMVASEAGRTEAIRRILAEGLDADVQESSGVTALMVASANGHTEAVRFLVEKGAEVDAKAIDGETALMTASKGGHVETVRFLLEMKADANASTTSGITPLMLASAEGHTDVVRTLLESSAEVGVRNAEGATALMLACENDRVGTAGYLVEHGADVNARSEEGVTALMLASDNGYRKAVELLLKHGAEVNAGSKNGLTALMATAGSGYVRTVRLLLENGARINVQDVDGRTALMYACQNGHAEAVNTLLDEGARIDERTNNSATALMLGSEYGHAEVVSILLGRDAEVNARRTDGATALMGACVAGYPEIAQLLIEAGANVDAETADGKTALVWACQNGHTATARLLLDKGAQVDAETTDGVTALMLACQYGHAEVVGILLGRDAEVNARRADGATALIGACVAGYPEIAQLLIEAGANVDAETADGKPALIWACQNGHTATAQLLLGKSADLEAEANDGGTALMAASLKGHVEVVRLLSEKGANVNARTVSGITPLLLASQGGYADIVRLLIEKGAEVNGKNNDGFTALMAASASGHKEIASLLIREGADLIADFRGNTALGIARSQGHTEVAELLAKAMESHLSTWLSEDMPIPPSDVLEHYERVRPTRFTTSAKVQFRVIDIKPSELKPSQVDSSVQETRQEAALRIATDLSERARKGEDFGGLAKLHSHGHQRFNGGLWPPVSPGALAPPYDVLGEHARNMQIGQVSQPLQKDSHVFVMRLEQRIPGSIQPFEEVKDSLERELRTLRRKRLEEALRR